MDPLNKFTDLMIQKIEEVDRDWQKPWFPNPSIGYPQNLSGRKYNGTNAFLLYLNGAIQNYSFPVYATFNQLQSETLSVKKGEKAFPVIYWNFFIKNEEGKQLTMDEYRLLSKREKEDYHVTPFLKYYNVFNVEQTNLKEKKPELWESLQDKFAVPKQQDEKGRFANRELDQLLEEKNWLCPIDVKPSRESYYSPKEDSITIPLKSQFKDGESFYGTLLHEMGHSTGASNRLNRLGTMRFGEPKYAKEELVAEMTSAVVSQSLGITVGIQENNAKYLKNWLSALKEEPKFLLSLLSDVGKASHLIQEKVQVQEKTLELPEKKGMGIAL